MVFVFESKTWQTRSVVVWEEPRASRAIWPPTKHTERGRRSATTRKVHLSPNALDSAFAPTGYERKPGPQTKIGYFGHLTEKWFDWESLIWIAQQRPDHRLEIIGHGAPDDIQLPSNIVLLGPKIHPEICEIAKEWHVGIIPFRVGRLADGVDPIKIHEYFALGLSVVSFRMPQTEDYPYTKTVEYDSNLLFGSKPAARLSTDLAHCRFARLLLSCRHKDTLLGDEIPAMCLLV